MIEIYRLIINVVKEVGSVFLNQYFNNPAFKLQVDYAASVVYNATILAFNVKSLEIIIEVQREISNEDAEKFISHLGILLSEIKGSTYCLEHLYHAEPAIKMGIETLEEKKISRKFLENAKTKNKYFLDSLDTVCSSLNYMNLEVKDCKELDYFFKLSGSGFILNVYFDKNKQFSSIHWEKKPQNADTSALDTEIKRILNINY